MDPGKQSLITKFWKPAAASTEKPYYEYLFEKEEAERKKREEEEERLLKEEEEREWLKDLTMSTHYSRQEYENEVRQRSEDRQRRKNQDRFAKDEDQKLRRMRVTYFILICGNAVRKAEKGKAEKLYLVCF
jgi:hypothetical protein